MSLPDSRVDEIFAAALEIKDPAERLHFVRRASGDDAALREDVESLLVHSAQVGTFLEQPAAGTPLAEPGHAADEARAARPVGPAEQAGERIGRFRLLERIGEGGMGTVWKAEQEEPVRRLVALKVIKLGLDTREVVARFEAERQALALMDHPNIAKVLDGGATGGDESQISNPKSQIPAGGRPFFVMELVRGARLTDYCDEQSLSTAQRLELFIQVCHAIQHAHQKGIIHRDLKPSNVLVAIGDSGPIPKVIDFGIAKATDQPLTDKTLFTHFLQILGTPAYMSPEQAQLGSADIDTRSDIYSLGVLLYELLTGRTPFDGPELLAAGLDGMRRVICDKEPPRPSTRLTALPPADLTTTATRRQTEPPTLIAILRGDLDWIVMRCLEKDRSHRYDTANALADDLQRHLEHEPVLARPPSALYRWQKFARKHRTGVAVAAGFVFLLASATVLSSTLALWANRERARAVDARNEATDVLEFFQNAVLSAARPRGEPWGLGPNATIRQAIRAAEPAITESFQHRPLVEASVRSVLGSTYYQLAEHQAGLTQHQRALSLRQTSLPPEDPAVLHSTEGIAAGFLRLGRLSEAAALLEKVLAIRQRRSGPDHDETLWTATQLASVYRDADKLGEATRLMEEVMRLQRAKPGEHTNLQAIATLNSLGRLYQAADRTNDALRVYTETLELSRRVLGRTSPDTLMALNNVGTVYLEQARYAEARAYLEEAVKLTGAVFGETNTPTLSAINNLALAELELGEHARAIALLEDAVKRATAFLSADHPDTIDLIASLALAHRRAGHFEKARPLFETAFDWRRKRLGPAHAQTLRLMDYLYEVYRALNMPNEALKMSEQAATIRSDTAAASSPLTPVAAAGRIASYRLAGQLANAEELLRQVLAEQRKPSNTNRFSLAATLYQLGDVLLEQKRYRDAEDVLSESRTILKEVQPGRTPALATQSALAATWIGQNKQLDEAEKLLLDAHRLLARRNTNNPTPTYQHLLRETAQHLAQLYEVRGLPDQAVVWKRKRAELERPPAAAPKP